MKIDMSFFTYAAPGLLAICVLFMSSASLNDDGEFVTEVSYDNPEGHPADLVSFISEVTVRDSDLLLARRTNSMFQAIFRTSCNRLVVAEYLFERKSGGSITYSVSEIRNGVTVSLQHTGTTTVKTKFYENGQHVADATRAGGLIYEPSAESTQIVVEITHNGVGVEDIVDWQSTEMEAETKQDDTNIN